MIEQTVLENDTILNIVKEKYNIDVTEIKKINRGSANLYSLNHDTYVLKEFQSKYTKEEIDKEISIINHLKKDSILVPEYLITVDNEYSFLYKGKVITLQKFIEGYTIESNTGTYDQTIESAKMLGQIVKSLKTLNIELPLVDVTEWYSEETLDEAIAKHKDLLGKTDAKDEQIIKDLTDKINMTEHIKEHFNFDDMDKVSIMNTHGDYSILQFIYKCGKINAIIDFVAACRMPIVWEIIRSYSYIDEMAKDGTLDIDNLIDYVKEFTKYNYLNKYDLKYMPYLYLVQLLGSTFGYKQYIKDNSKTELLEFALFRTRLCKFLFENAEIISKRLEDEII